MESWKANRKSRDIFYEKFLGIDEKGFEQNLAHTAAKYTSTYGRLPKKEIKRAFQSIYGYIETHMNPVYMDGDSYKSRGFKSSYAMQAILLQSQTQSASLDDKQKYFIIMSETFALGKKEITRMSKDLSVHINLHSAKRFIERMDNEAFLEALGKFAFEIALFLVVYNEVCKRAKTKHYNVFIPFADGVFLGQTEIARMLTGSYITEWVARTNGSVENNSKTHPGDFYSVPWMYNVGLKTFIDPALLKRGQRRLFYRIKRVLDWNREVISHFAKVSLFKTGRVGDHMTETEFKKCNEVIEELVGIILSDEYKNVAGHENDQSR
jgi:hypothetical protein